MKKRVLSMLLAMSLIAGGCGAAGEVSDVGNQVSSEDVPAAGDAGNGSDGAMDSGDDAAPQKTGTSLISNAEETIYYDPDLVPSVPDYQVASDFSNVTYHKNFAYLFESEYDSEYNDTSKMRNALADKGFAVRPDGYHEFFDVYEMNRYNMFPNFVTVDSLMHTYHLYFSYLLKSIEKESLSEKLKIVSAEMLARSTAQYESLKGTDFEDAALRNVALFYVGAKLQDPSVDSGIDDSSFAEVTDTEYNKIMEASAIEPCLLTGLNEDYTQYKPRGYYEGDEALEAYFRAMMWYGRISFALESEEMAKSAVLMSCALSQDDADYNSLYDVTSFFAGVSDDFTYGEMVQVLEGAYGKIPDVAEVAGDEAAFGKVVEALKKAQPPKINGIPVMENEENVIPSFRFMGQRFTIDAAIMQNLIYRAVEENPEGERRYLPDALDTAAALGSEEAFKILDEQGDTKFKNYTDNLAVMQETFDNSDMELWGASLYAGWLYTLRPLFEKRGSGYPWYMQNDEWNKKKLETFAGSYAELKHDTILYAKQVAAEMGGGDDEMPDDRGYVDPEPVIYSRFIDLSEKTSNGLEAAGMLSSAEKDDLALLSDIAKRLLDISEKELRNEALSDDDYEFIRGYGGNLEHFWQEVNAADGLDLAHSYQAPCPVIADIATDPNGTVLEVGSGKADTVFVVFPIDGELHVGSGSVYSFYQFTVPIDERMTDEEFRASLEGGYLDDDWNWVENDNVTMQPDWTQSYRIVTGNR
ncbi:MAG: DUF3160 domain-containing protein [Butyrivibrio sp.]|uniref:DUF3160 domain-containing protein n=1 Tax=Butyrivibrio sp. TaxID=28121 RepID=UPI001B3D5F8F|nr:DUF3160 domain-containing protein [Butyrivibrio sp.]MBP3782555.1 DUF3160 domain-containing protein [Butyrivibrio sp.]